MVLHRAMSFNQDVKGRTCAKRVVEGEVGRGDPHGIIVEKFKGWAPKHIANTTAHRASRCCVSAGEGENTSTVSVTHSHMNALTHSLTHSCTHCFTPSLSHMHARTDQKGSRPGGSLQLQTFSAAANSFHRQGTPR